MARRRRRKSALDFIRIPRLPTFNLDPETKKGILIVLVFAFGAIGILSLFDLAGVIGSYINYGMLLLFGWGKWAFPVILLAWCYMMYSEEKHGITKSNYIGLIIFVFALQALLLMFVEYDRWDEAIEGGQGGGYVGWLLAGLFVKYIGYIAALISTIGLIIISLLLIFDTNLVTLFGRTSVMGRFLQSVNFIVGKLFGKKFAGEEENEEEEVEDFVEEEVESDEAEEDEVELDDEEEGDEDEEEVEDDFEEAEPQSVPQAPIRPVVAQKTDNVVWWSKPTGLTYDIPLNLLGGKKGKPTSGDIKQNKEIIQSALANFGIDVEMGDVSVGPTVTQYTFKPAEGVRLAKIAGLGNDLALALAAHPIRIEAPIPGKSLVGVEVPNQTKALVGLRDLLNSDSFKNRKTNLTMALGKDVAGSAWMADVTRMPHLLVAGATNSGKSVCLNTIIVSLLFQNSPDDLRFIMVDPKRVELPVYNGLPHLMCPVITEVPATVNAMRWCLHEMDTRYTLLNKAGCKNIQAYNERNKVKMPYIVFLIDELADLMVAASKDIESCVVRLAQLSRAAGIHLVIATQRPSVDVITGLIKANMPARIAFSVMSGNDSRTILDTTGAEKLLGRGDMLYVNSDISKPVRIQGVYLSDPEISKVVRFIKDKSRGIKCDNNIIEDQKAESGGSGIFGSRGGGEGDDELLLEAKEIVIGMGKASTTLLQRKLRVGYARAASLMDSLEQIGVVGPQNGSKGREILISKEEFEAIESQGVSAIAMHQRTETTAPESFLNQNEEDLTPPVFSSGEEEVEDEEEMEDDDSGIEDETEDGENEEDEVEEIEEESNEEDEAEVSEEEYEEEVEEEDEEDGEESDEEEEFEEESEDESEEENADAEEEEEEEEEPAFMVKEISEDDNPAEGGEEEEEDDFNKFFSR